MTAAASIFAIARALLLLGPGALWVAASDDPLAWYEAPLIAAAFWIIEFWWQRMTGLPWRMSTSLLGLGSWALAFALPLILRARSTSSRPAVARNSPAPFVRIRTISAGALAFWTAAAIFWAALAATSFVPPGVDGAMHSAVARALLDGDGHPASFLPAWQLPFFHTYPVGQPTLTALLALITQCDLRHAALAGHALSFALMWGAFACGLGLVCAKSEPRDQPASSAPAGQGGASPTGTFGRGALLGAALLLLSRAPFSYWTWGGAPNALSFGLATLAVGSGLRLYREGRAGDALRLALYAVAAVLTHAVSPLGYAFLFALPLALGLFRRRARIAPFALALGLCALLLAPYLASFRWVLDASEKAWVATSARSALSHGFWPLFPATLHDVPLLLGGLAIAALVLFEQGRERALFRPPWLALWLAVGTLGLVLNGTGSYLPLSTALYPDRLVLLLLLPIGMLLNDALLFAQARLRALPKAAPIARWIARVAIALLFAHAAVLQSKLIRNGEEHALLTPGDLALMAREVPLLPPGCPVANNYGDGGQWLPALFSRPITLPQVNVIWFSEMPKLAHPCAAFRGEKLAYDLDTVTALCAKTECRSADREGNAEWFELPDPALQIDARGSR